VDEKTLEIDATATEAQRAELRANRDGRSLTEYFRDRLIPYNAPVSIASNAEFGMEAK
jgi:hypothetical protein